MLIAPRIMSDTMLTKADRYWNQFVQSLYPDSSAPERYVEFFYFGSEPEHGKPVGELVLAGVKTAGGDILWRREASQDPPLQVGGLSIFHDGYEEPLGIIETTSVEIVPFNEVDAEFARMGGEWGGSLEKWRSNYWSWIEAECLQLGREPARDIPMVCERYRLVYGEPLGNL